MLLFQVRFKNWISWLTVFFLLYISIYIYQSSFLERTTSGATILQVLSEQRIKIWIFLTNGKVQFFAFHLGSKAFVKHCGIFSEVSNIYSSNGPNCASFIFVAAENMKTWKVPKCQRAKPTCSNIKNKATTLWRQGGWGRIGSTFGITTFTDWCTKFIQSGLIFLMDISVKYAYANVFVPPVVFQYTCRGTSVLVIFSVRKKQENQHLRHTGKCIRDLFDSKYFAASLNRCSKNYRANVITLWRIQSN